MKRCSASSNALNYALPLRWTVILSIGFERLKRNIIYDGIWTWNQNHEKKHTHTHKLFYPHFLIVINCLKYNKFWKRIADHTFYDLDLNHKTQKLRVSGQLL